MWKKQRYCGQLQSHVWITNFRGRKWKNFHTLRIFVLLHGLMIWKVMRRNLWSDIVRWQTRRLNNSTKYLLHASMTTTLKRKKELNSVEELSQVCSQIVLKCLYLARIGRLDILWSVNKFARSITKWTKACDKRLNRLISYILHTWESKQYCYVGNTAKQCRLGTVSRLRFCGNLEDSKSTSSGTLCIFGSHTFVSISWMCKKQTSVFHTVQQNPRSSLWTQDWDWTVFPLTFCGIWLFLGLGITTDNHDRIVAPPGLEGSAWELVNLQGVACGMQGGLVVMVSHAQPFWLKRKSVLCVPVPSMTVNCAHLKEHYTLKSWPPGVLHQCAEERIMLKKVEAARAEEQAAATKTKGNCPQKRLWIHFVDKKNTSVDDKNNLRRYITQRHQRCDLDADRAGAALPVSGLVVVGYTWGRTASSRK